MREETILRKIRSGDPAGLEALMERYLPYVSTVVWNILRGAMAREDGEEVVSDVFLAAWRQGPDLRPGEVKAWLGAVARNKAKNRLRQAGRDLPLEEDALELPGPDDPPRGVRAGGGAAAGAPGGGLPARPGPGGLYPPLLLRPDGGGDRGPDGNEPVHGENQAPAGPDEAEKHFDKGGVSP